MKTSEQLLNIQKQPEDFCNYIDPAIKPFQDTLNIISEIEDIYYETMEQDYKNIDLSKINIPELNGLKKFEELIDEMKNWSSSWNEYLKLSSEKEEHKILKFELGLELSFFNNQIDRFDKSSRFFMNEILNVQSEIKSIYDELQKEIEALKNNEKYVFIDCTISKYEYKIKEFIELFEMLRSAAVRIRTCVNEDLKVKAKIQLYRCRYSKDIVEFLEHHNVRVVGHYINIKNYSRYNDIVSLKRDYA